MEDCIFCKIAKGEIPSHKVYEDDEFIGFLDIRPLTKGNALIVPKKHYKWTYDVPNFGQYFEVAKKVGLATQKTFDAEWICFMTLGLEIFHAHIRVIPRYKNDKHSEVVDLDRVEEYSEAEMEDIAKQIRENIDK